jgi:hypothetical protein
MGIDKSGRMSAASDLRRRAEELVNGSKPLSTKPIRIESDVMKLVHELKVHQIELEMQNSATSETLWKPFCRKAPENYLSLSSFKPARTKPLHSRQYSYIL